MTFRKNGLFKILLVILFLSFVSGGCGGGSSGGVSSRGNGNNGNSNRNTGQATEINGTWEIVSGYAVMSQDYSGKIETYHFTYAGKNEPVEIEMTQTYGYYMPRLTGKNVANGIMLTVFFTNDESGYEHEIPFTTNRFTYDGNGTYRMNIEDDLDGNGTNDNIVNGEFVMKLEDENTLRWIVHGESNTDIDIGFSYTAYHYEIVLKRAGSSYDPNDYNNNTSPDNNNGTNNNTSPNTNNSPNNNTAPDTPPQVNDTWEISSGSGLISQKISGRNYVSHLTYSPKRGDSGIKIDITQNDSTTYYGDYVGLFSVTLTGDNVINSGVKGSGAIRVSYSVAETPGSEASATFTGGKSFSYIGDGTYRMTTDNGEYTITLEGSSNIRWRYTAFNEGWYEIVLTKTQ